MVALLCSPDKLTDRRQGSNRSEDEDIPRIDFAQIRLPNNAERRRDDVTAEWVLHPDGHCCQP